MKKAFGIVSGEGLGLANTTYRLLGDSPIDFQPTGQAPIKSYVNIATGNLIAQTANLQIEELGGNLDFHWTFNSQATGSKNWRFSWPKQLTGLNSKSKSIQLLEADDHITTYKRDPKRGNQYFADQVGEGTPFIRYDETKKLWRRYEPKTNITEYYDKHGYLKSRETLEGHVTTFEYDSKRRLTTIAGPSGAHYMLAWQKNGMELACLENGEKTILRTYEFDVHGRLIEETFPATGYVINYKYIARTSILTSIIQTDKTEITFNYDMHSSKPSHWKVNTIQYGTVNRNTLDYSNHPTVLLTDNYQNQTQFTLDEDQLIAKVMQPTGYLGVDPQTSYDTTTYQYENGVITAIVQPDGSQIHYDYDEVYHLKTAKTGPNNQKHTWCYQPGGDEPLLITEADYSDPSDSHSALVTRYVYDSDFDDQDHAFLRFQISPAGRVTELRPDRYGDIGSKRHYLMNTFDVSSYPPDTVPAYQIMQKWTMDQDSSQVKLTDYTRNPRGQVLFEKQYTAVDQQGNGIANATMGDIQRAWTISGDCWMQTTQQDADTSATTTHRFDDLRRETLRVEAVSTPLERTWEWDYTDASQQVLQIQPNQRLDVNSWDTQGLATQNTATVSANNAEQTRLTQYRRDHNGLPILTITPTLATDEADLPRVHQFFDRQYRQGFTVTPSGIVTETRYDAEHRITFTIQYALPVNVQELYLTWPPAPTDLPAVDKLVAQLPNPLGPDDRVTLKTVTSSSKPQYRVDGERYLQEIRYDNLDRPVVIITYEEQITDEEWQLLLNGQTLNRQPNPLQDRIKRTFYGLDNEKIATQDAAGYVIEYIRDAAGRIKQQIQYATPVVIDLAITDFNDVRPERDPAQDAINYFFYDARGQCIAEVDAGDYLTISSYLSCGLKQSTTRFATKIDPAWFNDPTIIPPNPPASTEDQTTTSYYDLLNRPIEMDMPMNKAALTQYDVMGNVLYKQAKDLLNPANVDPDFQRNTQAQFDGWNQAIAEADPRIGQILAAIDANPDLSPAQKAAQKAFIWFNQSTLNSYDATGLKCYSDDNLDNRTFYFYDADRRPLIMVKPTGIIIEKTLNAFGENIQTRSYKNKIPPNMLSNLTGGLITTDFRNYLNGLQDPDYDQILQLKPDQRGQIIQKIDPEGFVTTNSYNAFKQIATENLPVTNQQPSLVIKHEYEPRGLEIQTSKIADGKIITTEQTFANLYGKRTQFTDELNNNYTTDYNPLGQLATQKNPITTTATYERDAFDRVLTETDALSNTTMHAYNQVARTETISFPVAGTQKILTSNIFNEKIQETDSLNNNADNTHYSNQFWLHAPDGQVSTYTDALGKETRDDYDLLGQHTYHTDAHQVVTEFGYNGAGQLIRKTEDATGLQLETTITPDAFGNAERVVDPRNVITRNTFDRRNLMTESVIDPDNQTILTDIVQLRVEQGTEEHNSNSQQILPLMEVQQGIQFRQDRTKNILQEEAPLNLITQQTYNGQRKTISKIQGDASNPQLYQEQYLIDGFNRSIGKIIDPLQLQITTEQTLDGHGNVIAEQDPNGNITYKFYDTVNRERFTVDNYGGVSERNYDNDNRLQYTRNYQIAIDFSQLSIQITLAELMAMINPDPQDSFTYYFYDDNGNVRFTVDSLGIVNEKRYDSANQEIQTIGYATVIDTSNLATLTTEQLATLMQEKASSSDRTTYHIYDAAGQERFTIDSLGFIKEQRFDDVGQIITKVSYVNPVSDPAAVAQLTPEQVYSTLTPDATQDRVIYQVFDALRRPWFTVDAEGGVTRFDHDENGNLKQQYQFYQPITLPASYDALVALLKNLPADPNDRITQKQYDTANRLTQISQLNNGETYSDQYKLDAASNIQIHTDRAGNSWTNYYDGAKRLTMELSPSTTVTQITADPITGALNTTPVAGVQVMKQTTYDSIGNKKVIVQGIPGSDTDLTDTRIFNASYDVRNQLQSTTLNNVAIDNPAAPASYSSRPETEQNISTAITYNAKRLPVVEKNEAGNLTFKVYDSANHLCFRLKAITDSSTDAVQYILTEYIYNAFGEVSQKINYATQLNIDVQPYLNTGIPLSVVQQAKQNSPDDRMTTYERDNCGNLTAIVQGDSENPDIFYYLPNKGVPIYGLATKQTKKQYNAFKECICESSLIDVENDNPKWADNYKWKDRNGKLAAECNSELAVKRYYRNAFTEEEKRIEYAAGPIQPPSITMTLAELDAAMPASPGKDRTYTTDYDQLGQIIKETRVGVTVQEVDASIGTPPSFKDADLPQNLSKSYQYNPLGKKIAITYEDGSTQYLYYDERNLQIAKADIPREGFAQNIMIPLTYFGVNAHGQQVIVTRFKIGTAHADTTTLPVPVPISTDPDDQTELTLFDNRGLTAYKQDAEGNVTGFTYTPTRKIGRQWWRLTNITEDIHIDERRFTYDDIDRPTFMSLYRDAQLQQKTQSFYNAFGNAIFEGPGDGSQPIYRRFDGLGNLWSTNAASGVNTIKLYDVTGRESATLVSPTQNLSQTNYSQLEDILNWGPADLERTEMTRDSLGRVIYASSPTQTATPNDAQADIPLNMLVSKGYSGLFDNSKTCITWVMPQERIVKPILTIWPIDHPELTQTLTIISQDGRCGIDVSDKITDVYQYQIDYSLTDPTNPENVQQLYTTQGRIQFDTGIIQGSYAVVVTINAGSQLQLTGNTANVIGIELWQDNEKIATINDIDQSSYHVDLSKYPSGRYTVKPITSNGQDLPFSLPFTIHTPVPAQQPLATEIPCEVSMASLDSHVQLRCSLPAQYGNLPARLQCNYIDDAGEPHLQILNHVSLTDYEKYTDNNGFTLYCNAKFEHPVQSIQSLSLSLKIANKEYLPLMVNIAPSAAAKKAMLEIGKKKEEDEKDWVVIQKSEDTSGKGKEPVTDDNSIYLKQGRASDEQAATDLAISAESVGSGIVNTSFDPRLILLVTGVSEQGKPPLLNFKDTSLDRMAVWKQTMSLGTTREGFVLDMTGIPPGRYPFKLLRYPEEKEAERAVVVENENTADDYIDICQGGMLYPSERLATAAPDVFLGSIRTNTYDKWNNLLSQTDSLGNTTQFIYNDQNRMLTKIQPQVTVVDEHGKSSQQNPVTGYAYNACGFNIGIRDPNNNTEGYILNAAGQKLQDILGDGTLARAQDFDALGCVTRRSNANAFARGLWWSLTYDRNNQLKQQISPQGRKTTYSYNELSYRTQVTNNANNTYTYLYDINSNISIRIEPMGQRTRMLYDRNNKMTTIYNPDGSTMGWGLDYFGNTQTHTDLGSAFYTYDYDWKGQKKHQRSTGGSHGGYVTTSKYVSNNGFILNNSPVAGQDLTFVYNAGFLMQVTDNALGQISQYDYDSEGRRTMACLKRKDGSLIRDARTVLDALGRETWSYDSMMVVTSSYDANSNRRHVSGGLHTSDWQHQTDTEELWYTYDQASRVLIDGGSLIDGTISVDNGMQLGYVNGLRATQTIHEITTTLGYDADDILTGTDASTGHSQRELDPTGTYVVTYTANQGSNSLTREDVRNPNGWQTNDNQTSNGSQSRTSYFNFTQTGLPTQQWTDYGHAYIDKLNNRYVAYDEFKLSGIYGRQFHHSDHGGYSSCGRVYDPNGNISSISGSKGDSSPGTGNVLFNSTYDGLVLEKLNLTPYVSGNFNDQSNLYSGRLSRYAYTVNGQYMGSYSLVIVNPYNPDGSINMNYIRHGVGARGGYEVGYNSSSSASYNSNGIGWSKNFEWDWTRNFLPSDWRKKGSYQNWLIAQAKLSQAYGDLGTITLADPIQPVTLGVPASSAGGSRGRIQQGSDGGIEGRTITFPPLASGSYMPGSGDSYSDIAESQYGDPSYSAALASTDHSNANSGDLAAPVTMPALIPLYNKANTYIAQDQVLSQLMGAFYPLMDHPDEDSGSWFTAFVEFVAIVVACIVAAPLGVGLAAALMAASVAAAVDIAGQVLGEKLGLTDHFSLREAMETGIEAGFTVYFAPELDGVMADDMQAEMISAGKVAVSDQLTEMALGWRSSFDIQGVAQSIIAAGSNVALSRSGAFSDGLVGRETSGLVSNAAGTLMTGQNLNLDALAGQALGMAAVYPLQQTQNKAQQRGDASYQTTAYDGGANTQSNTGTATSDDDSTTDSAQQQARKSRLKRYNQQSAQTSSQNASRWAMPLSMADVVDATEGDLLVQALSANSTNNTATSATTSSATSGSGSNGTFFSRLWSEAQTSTAHFIETEQAFNTGIYARMNSLSPTVVAGSFGISPNASLYAGYDSVLGDQLSIAELNLLGAGTGVSWAWNLFKAASPVPNINASNNINLLRLQKQLSIEEQQTLFNSNGSLSIDAIKNSRLIISSDEFGNKELIAELSNRAGNLSDWSKYTTDPIHTPAGNFEVHFYYNAVTEDAYYGMDYKATLSGRNTLNENPSPKFDYMIPKFNN